MDTIKNICTVAPVIVLTAGTLLGAAIVMSLSHLALI